MSISIVLRFSLLAASTVLLSACLGFGGSGSIIPAMKQIPAEAQVLLAKQGMKPDSPIFVRIFKAESELEVWKEKEDGRYYHFKTYPICTWSGDLGPKVKNGDKQAPEGFYTVTPGQMNPNSQFHLAFNLGYPNAYDKANGRTGSALMVHGDCRSAGCFAMTDALIEEIYALAREAFEGGQKKFHVHAFPFRMTKENLEKQKKSKWYAFWKTLKHGYDDFELSRIPPKVSVCSKQYLVNANFFGQTAEPDPGSTCPAYRREPATPFNPFGGDGGAQEAKANTAADRQDARYASYSTAASGKPDNAEAKPVKAEIPTPKAEAIASKPASAAQDSISQTASVSAQPPITASSRDDNEVDSPTLSGAVAVSETSDAEAKKEAEKSLQTHGIHNVMGSGKGDMRPEGHLAR